MPLNKKDMEWIERCVYKNADDIAVSIMRSFERLEERIDALESRINSRIADAEDRMESNRQDIGDSIGDVKDALIPLLTKKS